DVIGGDAAALDHARHVADRVVGVLGADVGRGRVGAGIASGRAGRVLVGLLEVAAARRRVVLVLRDVTFRVGLGQPLAGLVVGVSRRVARGRLCTAVLRDIARVIAPRLGHRVDLVVDRLVGVGRRERRLVAAARRVGGLRDLEQVALLVAVGVAAVVGVLDAI